MQKQREHELMDDIRLALSQRGFAVFRANVGTLKQGDRYIGTGLPKGFSDLFAVRNGKIYFIECKVKPNKPSAAQEYFLKNMRGRYGAAAGVAHSVEEALSICGE